MSAVFFPTYPFFFFILFSFACNDDHAAPSAEIIKGLNLKRGEAISCGDADKQFGTVNFNISGPDDLKENFNFGIKLLHSFEYDEAEKAFATVIEKYPDCAMAYWGIAMANFHPLWAPPTPSELIKGQKAIEVANSIGSKSRKETDYIHAIDAYYAEHDKADHRTRCARFEAAMKKLYEQYPDDKEAAIFYALSMNAAADPADKTFRKQKEAGRLLQSLYPNEPNHPGIVHYIIHTYDYPDLAQLALPAARQYASVAPSSAHALHMPSHIFTRLGLWDECIASNLQSVAAARCYAEAAGIKGHWDEELHGMDYLMYGYLQKGDNVQAANQLKYLQSIKEVHPANFKVAYAFASIPARYYLENKLWKEAANMQPHTVNFAWKDYPWQKAIVHFARLMGAVNIGRPEAARRDLDSLHAIHSTFVEQKDTYKANQVLVQVHTAKAWMLYKEGKSAEAVRSMLLAADLEDKTEKHPVTAGEVLPARELLGDLLFQLGKYDQALHAYESSLKKLPNRFNSLSGAAMAAEKTGDHAKAKQHYQQLRLISNGVASDRKELEIAGKFLAKTALVNQEN